MKLLLEKQGLPEEGELLICVVSKIHFHSIFVNIVEYGKQQGMIHISEVSPGRIRNIRDYVKEDKTVVCKVLRINRERGYVDLSLRRVTDREKRKKVDDIKQEQVAEKIIEFVAKEMKLETKKTFLDVRSKVIETYDSLFDAFYDVIENNLKLESLGIDKKVASALEDIVRQRIKPIEVEIKGHFKISSYLPEGVTLIREALVEGNKVVGNHRLSYTGAGIYSLIVKDKDYKKAEKVLADIKEAVISNLKYEDTECEFIRA